MRPTLILAAACLLGAAAPHQLLTPNDIVASAPKSAWRQIPSDDLLVMDLKAGGRIVIQLAPPIRAPVHVANIRALAHGGYWAGSTVYRVQDDYVAQWGHNDSDKPLPANVVAEATCGIVLVS